MAKSQLLNYVGWYNGIGDHLKTGCRIFDSGHLGSRLS